MEMKVTTKAVIPAKAGIHFKKNGSPIKDLGDDNRRNLAFETITALESTTVILLDALNILNYFRRTFPENNSTNRTYGFRPKTGRWSEFFQVAFRSRQCYNIIMNQGLNKQLLTKKGDYKDGNF
jgi:hypothetical protein